MQECAFARAGFASDNHYLVVSDGREEFVATLCDRQFGRVGADRYRRKPAGELFFGLVNFGGELGDDLGSAFHLLDFGGALDPAAKPSLVSTRHRVETLAQRCELFIVSAWCSFPPRPLLRRARGATRPLFLDSLVAFVHRNRIRTQTPPLRAVSQRLPKRSAGTRVLWGLTPRDGGSDPA